MVQKAIKRESVPVFLPDVVALGAYTEITEIVAPASATPGSRVDITVKIKNNYSYAFSIMVGGALEYDVPTWPSITFLQDLLTSG